MTLLHALQLGDCYYDGNGVEKSHVTALEWFRKVLREQGRESAAEHEAERGRAGRGGAGRKGGRGGGIPTPPGGREELREGGRATRARLSDERG